jgi:outer membrane protein OmpA-like peptidoglycan-associated protein/TolB-like protein
MKKIKIYSVILTLIANSCGYTYRSSYLNQTNNWSRIKCVAIMPFQNLTEYPKAGEIMSDIIATEFYITQRFGVAERTEVQRFIDTVGLVVPQEIDATFARKIGEMMNVDAVLVGAVTEFWYRNARQKFSEEEPIVGAGFKLIDVKTGEVLWSSSYTRTSYDILLTQRDPLNRIAQIVAEKATFSLHEIPLPSGKIELNCADGWKTVAQKKLEVTQQAEGQTKTTRKTEQTTAMTPAVQRNQPVVQQPPPLTDPEAIALSKQFVRGKSIIMREIKFQGNTSVLEQGSYVYLDRIGKILQSRSDIKIRIDAHSDPFGSEEECLALTNNWANTIRNYLITKYSIPEDRVSAKGFGSSLPLMPNVTKRGREMNRRIEITILESK